MNNMLTIAAKELLLLRRDPGGLLVLFLMPAVLVLIITMVQKNVMELTGEQQARLLFIDESKSEFGQSLTKIFADDDSFVLFPRESSERDQALAEVKEGEYTACVIVSKGIDQTLTKKLAALFAGNADESGSQGTSAAFSVSFDPALLPAFRGGVIGKLKVAAAQVEMKKKINHLEAELTKKMEEAGMPPEAIAGEAVALGGLADQLVEVREEEDSDEQDRPGVVQQNVPAWALFGMFFTVLPLGGALLRERRSGVWDRFLSMPLSPMSVLMGKVTAYSLVCLLQFALIGGIGYKVFPMLGLPAFSIAGAEIEIFVTVVAVSLAACGYGLLLGMICSSFEQVSMFGSISIVISAAIGGIMVPVYAMPEKLQQLSVVSPLNWGLTSFHDVLIRDTSLWRLDSGVLFLILFSAVCITLSWRLAAGGR
ncbi:MAG: ABC transporter permease [Thermodesulfobacteriota bacterium]